MREIFSFKEANHELCLFINDGKLVYAKRDKDKNITYDLTPSEQKLIKDVFYKLLPSNYIKDLGYFKYGNKEINHLYDFHNKFHIFYEGNQDITDDVLYLSYIFNNQEEYFADYDKLRQKRIRNDKIKFIKRKLRVNGKNILIKVLVGSLILIQLHWIGKMGRVAFSNLKETHEEAKNSMHQDRLVSYSEIEKFINQNSNLSDSEKEIILSSPMFFIDGYYSFDYATIKNNLESIDIVYLDEVREDGVEGYYKPDKNEIGIYETEEDNIQWDLIESTLSHEFIHSTSMNSNEDNEFYEIVTTILNDEYYGGDNSYTYLRKYLYLLAEILDPEVIRNYHAKNEIKYLVEELVKIDPDYEKAEKLFVNIDMVGKIVKNIQTDSLEYAKMSTEYQEIDMEILETLKSYYEVKHASNIEDDFNAFFWYNPQVAVTQLASEYNYDDEKTRQIAILNASKYIKIKQYKTIFNTKPTSDNKEPRMVVSIPYQYEAVTKIYSLEEILRGDAGLLYRSEEEIDLPKNPDGGYIVVEYQPSSYRDVSIRYTKKELMVKK